MKTNVMRLLDEHGIEYQLKPHKNEVFTTADAARERGVRTEQIVKTMLVRTDTGDDLVVLVPGDRRLSTKKVAAALGHRRVFMAPRDDITKLTGFPLGAVSPIGLRSHGMQILFDQLILREERVDISSGRPDAGIELSARDLRSVVGGLLGDFSEPE